MARGYQMGQAEVDGMELWVLGVLLNPDGFDAEVAGDRMMTPEEFQAEAIRLNRERVAAASQTPAPIIGNDQPAGEV